MTFRDAKNMGSEAIWLLEKATGMNMTELRLADDNTVLGVDEERQFLLMAEELKNHVPLQYVLGSWGFMNLEIKCEPGVLIPRRDTETLAEEAIKYLKSFPRFSNVLDLCTGTGCVGLSLAPFCKNIVLSDISAQAVELAKKNAELNNIGGNITFVQSDLFESISGRFSLITANPPYVPTDEISRLPEEVRREPMAALDGGADGLDFYRKIIPGAYEYLLPGGSLFLETGSSQAKKVAEMLHKNGYKAVVTVKDLENRDRVVHGTKTRV